MGFGSTFNRKKKQRSLSNARSSAAFAAVVPLINGSFFQVFKKFDVNGDGKILSSELGSIMGSLGHKPSEEELRKIMNEFDADGNGFINFKEFVDLNTRGVDSDEVVENLKDAFSVYDIDGDDSISTVELHEVLRSLADECLIAECRKMISGVDQDEDGRIDFEEFKVMMMAGARYDSMES